MIEHRATIANTPGTLLDEIAGIARRNGYAADDNGTRLEVVAPIGKIELWRRGSATNIRFFAETAPKMQLFKELYAERLETLGIDGSEIDWDHSGERKPPNQHMARLVSTERLSPGFQRLRLEGDFSAFAQAGAGLHFRFLLHPDRHAWPSLDDRGLIYWPDGIGAWHRPVFTIRKMGEKADWIDVDIALHDGGRTSAWATAISQGDEIAMHGPNGSSLVSADWMGLIGDETALPVIARLIEHAAPDVEGSAIIMLRHSEDAQNIENRSGISIRYENMEADPSTFVPEISGPSENAHYFFAGERAQATAMRAAFKDAGLDGRCASYWTA